uniref:Calcium-binding and coiled-coil domain-containing protein 2 n=1 Tax=Geotrypetes seraphini TaxID=260995 RepID=A0A6P8PFA7_GEOSA|nr:calcium-binding and coiled-coil domain-containing protein 2 isoform X2 [Geotrypetes seraphini]
METDKALSLSVVDNTAGPAEKVNLMGDEPSTFAIILEHENYSHVIFNKMEKSYSPGEDITCFYKLAQDMHPQKKDWLGVFRVGWRTTREFYTFMWAPLPSDSEEQQQLKFKAYYLPKDKAEFYQFCYVDQDGLVRGASVPFQIRQEVEEEVLLVTTEGEMQAFAQQSQNLLTIKMELEELQLEKKNIEAKFEKSQESVTALERTMHSLQSKNSELQKALDTQTPQLETLQRNLGRVKELNERLYQQNKALQEELDSLRSISETVAHNETLLKKEKETMEAKKSCMQTELHQLNKQIEKLRTEQEVMKNKLTAAQDAMNSLQQKHKGRLEEQLKQEQQQHLKALEKEKMNEVSSLKKEIEDKKCLIIILQMEKEDLNEDNQKLKKEIEKVSAHFPEESWVSFGNPGPASQEDVTIEKKSLKHGKNCPETLSDPDIGHPYLDPFLICPSCEQLFEASNKQLYEDHVLCHVLESSLN